MQCLIGRLLVGGGQAGRDRAEDRHGEQVSLDLRRLETPGTVDALLDLAPGRHGPQVANDGGLGAKVKMLLDVASGRRHAVLRLELAEVVEDGILTFGEHVFN